jgi:hypothetical protein
MGSPSSPSPTLLFAGLVMAGHGRFSGCTRGEAAQLALATLKEKGLWDGETACTEEILISKKFSDVVHVRKVQQADISPSCCRLHAAKCEANLRQPFLFVAKSQSDHVPLSADINMAALDNKATVTITGRTGGFCSACTSDSSDMLGDRPKDYYYMNLGTASVRDHFQQLYRDEFGEAAEGMESAVIPSKKGDYRVRLGTKHSPLTDEVETTQVSLPISPKH